MTISEAHCTKQIPIRRNAYQLLRPTRTFVARLQRRLGDQHIDVLVLDPLTPRQPVHEHAMRQGVTL